MGYGGVCRGEMRIGGPRFDFKGPPSPVGDAGAASAVAVENDMLAAEGRPLEKSRERAELEEGCRTLGIKPPWA